MRSAPTSVLLACWDQGGQKGLRSIHTASSDYPVQSRIHSTHRCTSTTATRSLVVVNLHFSATQPDLQSPRPDLRSGHYSLYHCNSPRRTIISIKLSPFPQGHRHPHLASLLSEREETIPSHLPTTLLPPSCIISLCSYFLTPSQMELPASLPTSARTMTIPANPNVLRGSRASPLSLPS